MGWAPQQGCTSATSGLLALPECLTVLHAHEQKILGEDWDVGSGLNGLPSVRSVANAVIQRVWELDAPEVLFEKDFILRQDHWMHYKGPEELILAEPYPAHALISVATNEIANDVADYLNSVFENERMKYPRRRGWHALAAHYRAPIPFDRHHPFFRYVNTNVLDSECCRFLVVNEMAVEGMNNRYLLVWGIAENLSSLILGPQRTGRCLRSAAVRIGNKLYVPPASHDRIYIITHETFGSCSKSPASRTSTVQTIAWSVNFILNMREATEEMMSLDEYIALETDSSLAIEVNKPMPISLDQKYAIAAAVAGSLEEGRVPDVEQMAKQLAGNNEFGRAMVRAYVDSALRNEPVIYQAIRGGRLETKTIDAVADLQKSLLRIQPPEPDPILEAERLFIRTFDRATATEWLNKYDWGQAEIDNLTTMGEAVWLRHINRLHRSWVGHFDVLDMDIPETPAERLEAIAGKIVRVLKVPGIFGEVRDLVFEGAVNRLGGIHVNNFNEFKEGGSLCKPVVTFAFRAESFASQIQQWVTYMLIRNGHLGKLRGVFRDDNIWGD
jgi:hypothetical protein